MKIKNIKIKLSFLLVFTIGIAIRFLGIDFLSNDMKFCLLKWYDKFVGMSFGTMLRTQVGNYNTVYQILLWILTKIPGTPIVKIKVLSIIFDIILSFGVYFLTKEIKDKQSAVVALCVTFLLPTVWLNSGFWGQCDSIYVSVIIWALYAFYKKHNVSGYIILGVALTLKLQTVFIFPFIGYLTIKELYENIKNKDCTLGKVVELFAPALFVPLAFVELLLPNIIAGRKVSDILSIYVSQTNIYPKMYSNYPSIWTIIPFDYSSGHTFAIFLTFVALALLIFWLLKNSDKLSGRHYIWCAFLFSYLCVLLLPAMHERYGYLYEILAVIVVVVSQRGYLKLFLLQMISIETYLFYLCHLGCQYWLLTFINVGLFVAFFVAFKNDINGLAKPCELFDRKQYDSNHEDEYKKDKRRPLIILGITVLFFVIGLFRLGSHIAPQTGMLFSKDTTHEVVLNFDQYKNVKRIEIYTGEKETGSVSVYFAEKGKWKQIENTDKCGSVFSWIPIQIDKKTYSFDLIISEKIIREIVIIDSEGNQILPQNANDYPLLFDEQNCYVNPPTYYNSMMFDEVYHGRTAFEYVNGLEIYETTHPPFGKSVIAIGIKLFGMNPFGWRIMSLLFGTLMIPLICMFVYAITKKDKYCYLAGVLVATEFMHFTLSRIATIDIIVALFITGMLYGMFVFTENGKIRYLIFSGFMSAFGIATKWTAFYAFAGIAILWFIWFLRELKNKQGKQIIGVFMLSVLMFIIIPILVYCLSYLPYYRIHPENGIVRQAVNNSIHMLNYHKNVFESHPYESPWYSWLINWRPLLDSYTNVENDRVSTVATFMNPFISILGLISVIHHFYLVIFKRDKVALKLLIFYLSMLVPWIFISRTVFIYQYFVCGIITILMICHSINLMRYKNENKVLYITAIISIAIFIMYYPVISGIPIHNKYIHDILEFMPKWIL